MGGEVREMRGVDFELDSNFEQMANFGAKQQKTR
jgi:hypothetical protein